MSFSSSMFSGGFNEFLDHGLSPLWWMAVSVDVTEALKIPFFWKFFFFFFSSSYKIYSSKNPSTNP